METSFWYGKGDIPNEKIRLPPLEVHCKFAYSKQDTTMLGLTASVLAGRIPEVTPGPGEATTDPRYQKTDTLAQYHPHPC